MFSEKGIIVLIFCEGDYTDYFMITPIDLISPHHRCSGDLRFPLKWISLS